MEGGRFDNLPRPHEIKDVLRRHQSHLLPLCPQELQTQVKILSTLLKKKRKKKDTNKTRDINSNIPKSRRRVKKKTCAGGRYFIIFFGKKKRQERKTTEKLREKELTLSLYKTNDYETLTNTEGHEKNGK